MPRARTNMLRFAPAHCIGSVPPGKPAAFRAQATRTISRSGLAAKRVAANMQRYGILYLSFACHRLACLRTTCLASISSWANILAVLRPAIPLQMPLFSCHSMDSFIRIFGSGMAHSAACFAAEWRGGMRAELVVDCSIFRGYYSVSPGAFRRSLTRVVARAL